MKPEEQKENIRKIFKGVYDYINAKEYALILILLLVKILFQLFILSLGYKWLSADDYCRTVKSFEWVQRPEISSGVWLTPHFWLNGFAMIFIKDLYASATFVTFLFSTITLIYFYKLIRLILDRKTAFMSAIIYCFFPFQVWLGVSGLPESVFFFFIITGIYCYLKWRIDPSNHFYLLLSALSFALSNGFRYEGWFFSIVLSVLVLLDIFKEKKFTKQIFINFLFTLISYTTIVWWLIQNYIDHKDVFFFAKETTRIYADYNNVPFLQRLVQYPIFIFYIAPITTFFSLKVIYDFLKKGNPILKAFILFNILEVTLLIIQAAGGTGGTNMISRYVVINAMLFIPLAVYQIFRYRKWLAAGLFIVINIVNIIWSVYYPQPFREDTFETGRFLKSQISKNYMSGNNRIYFEEVEGYYDVFAVQTLSNNPSKFVLGNLPSITIAEKKTRKKGKPVTDEEMNILDIKSFLEKNKIGLAVVKSDSYTDKLKKISYKNEEIGDYKIFYIIEPGSNLNDSTISIFSKNVINLKQNKNVVNFNRFLTIKDVRIDNTNFGMNPQTVSIDWAAADKNILDSIDYDNYEFDRYEAVVELKNVDNDSTVHVEKKKIFSNRNIEELIEQNNVRTIIVIKPFALLQYSKKFTSSPFESGVYSLYLKVRDNKDNKDLVLYRGDSLYKDSELAGDEKNQKSTDTLKIKTKPAIASRDPILTGYNLGNIIAMFPNTNYNLLITKSSSDVYRFLMQNSFRLFFSQRYQGDKFLNWVFTYF